MADMRKKNPYEEIRAELPQPSGYKVLEPPQDSPGQSREPEPIIFPVEPPKVVVPTASEQAMVLLSLLMAQWKERLRKFRQNPIRVYAAAGIGLGIFFGIALWAFLHFVEGAEGRYDLGAYASSAAGLKGHLFVEWDKKLKYRLIIEPEEAVRLDGFALAVTHSPQPLSITLHLQDSQGFILCSKDVLVKFDPRGAAAFSDPIPQSPAISTDAASLDTAQPAPTPDFAKLDAQEAMREKDQDIFQNQIGPDGTITALNAQGETPCSKSAYARTMLWSFTPNFPSLAEQDALIKRQQDLLSSPPPPPPPTHKKKSALKPLPFTIEGDDAIVEFDPSFGVIETRGRKLFLIDKATAAAANTAWQDFPVSIHFHCDQMSNCVLMHSGLGALRVRMKR